MKKNAKNNAKNNVNNINNDITMDNKNEGNITEQRKLNEKDEKIYWIIIIIMYILIIIYAS